MSLIYGLPRDELSNKDGRLTAAWAGWLSRVQFILLGIGNSGTTAQRPTDGSLVWIGYEYYDTTLTKPIWVSSLGPPLVWRDAAANVV